jgi:hypothetical protein
MKYVQTDRTNGKKEILKFPDHYVALAVTVDDAGVTAGADGKKIVPAGTILGGGFLASETAKAVKTNATGAQGVLFYDVDVTYGPAAGAAIIHGFIDLDKLPEAPAAAAVTELNMIKFIK